MLKSYLILIDSSDFVKAVGNLTSKLKLTIVIDTIPSLAFLIARNNSSCMCVGVCDNKNKLTLPSDTKTSGIKNRDSLSKQARQSKMREKPSAYKFS